MTGRNSLHYCYDVSYQCWFASEEAKIYCNNFNSSNAVVCSHLILAYTVRLAIMNAVELERNGCCCCFFYLYWGNDVLWFKRTSTKKLPNRIRYQIWYNGCLKGKFGKGVQIRGRSKSAVTPEEAFWATVGFGNGTVLPKVQSTRKLWILSSSLDILLFLR